MAYSRIGIKTFDSTSDSSMEPVPDHETVNHGVFRFSRLKAKSPARQLAIDNCAVRTVCRCKDYGFAGKINLLVSFTGINGRGGKNRIAVYSEIYPLLNPGRI